MIKLTWISEENLVMEIIDNFHSTNTKQITKATTDGRHIAVVGPKCTRMES